MITLKLTPELLIVPVNAPVLLTCEVYYNGCSNYSVRWYSDSVTRTVIHRTMPDLVNNSTLNYTLNVTSEYKGTHIHCEMTTSEFSPSTEKSNAITVKAISEGDINISYSYSTIMVIITLTTVYYSWSCTKPQG